MALLEEVLGVLFSFLFWGLEIMGAVVLIGTAGAWYGADQLAQSVAATMAQQGGYTETCRQMVAAWETGNHVDPALVRVRTPDGPGTAPVPYGDTVSVEISREVPWGFVTLGIDVKSAAVSVYLPQAGPSFTYVSPP